MKRCLKKRCLFIRLSTLVDPAPATAARAPATAATAPATAATAYATTAIAPATAPSAAGAMILEIISVSTDVLNYTQILEYLTDIRAYTFKIAFRWTF
jgi:hypothetical protein